ncbi:Akinase anchor protein 17Alike [Caligus rogercresseyi]|uniref:Akinase anchor protein 17Alike n=1 Tax=Caligus rogercresseyi TaxID=217165 RepID=A0A7T8HGE5_CALRO|nr:Akinase anchor protein 17Alike [Caligus rogercresseyi]
MDRVREADARRLALKNHKREEEQAKEELYDKMMNPHLYAGDGEMPNNNSSFGGPRRRPKRGEHYEQVQKDHLENEIRIRERRERMRQRMEEKNKTTMGIARIMGLSDSGGSIKGPDIDNK